MSLSIEELNKRYEKEFSDKLQYILDRLGLTQTVFFANCITTTVETVFTLLKVQEYEKSQKVSPEAQEEQAN